MRKTTQSPRCVGQVIVQTREKTATRKERRSNRLRQEFLGGGEAERKRWSPGAVEMSEDGQVFMVGRVGGRVQKRDRDCMFASTERIWGMVMWRGRRKRGGREGEDNGKASVTFWPFALLRHGSSSLIESMKPSIDEKALWNGKPLCVDFLDRRFIWLTRLPYAFDTSSRCRASAYCSYGIVRPNGGGCRRRSGKKTSEAGSLAMVRRSNVEGRYFLGRRMSLDNAELSSRR